jgi:hypothetical protein
VKRGRALLAMACSSVLLGQACMGMNPARMDDGAPPYDYSCVPAPGLSIGCTPFHLERGLVDAGAEAIVYPVGCVVCARSGAWPSRCVESSDTLDGKTWSSYADWFPLSRTENFPPLPRGCPGGVRE